MQIQVKIILIFALAIYALAAEAKQNRSYHAIKQFKIEHPCPANGRHKGRCAGYVIDHIRPLACDGLDSPKNMQWQTIEDAKAKDKWERAGC